jgi:hypothetical protein
MGSVDPSNGRVVLTARASTICAFSGSFGTGGVLGPSWGEGHMAPGRSWTAQHVPTLYLCLGQGRAVVYAPQLELPSRQPSLSACRPRRYHIISSVIARYVRGITCLGLLGREVIEVPVELTNGAFQMQFAPFVSTDVSASMVRSMPVASI